MKEMDFENQELKVENELYRIQLKYNSDGPTKVGKLQLICEDLDNHEIFRKSIDTAGGFWLSKRSEEDSAQSVKIWTDRLLIALHENLLCFQLPQIEMIWNLSPDDFPIYEFLDIENDILLRGELQIFRINRDGEVVWRTHGEDIWVNIEGEREMQIIGNRVILTDFNGKTYDIDVERTRTMPKNIETKRLTVKRSWMKKLFGK